MPFISEQTAWKLYYAHVNSHITYLNSIWGLANQKSITSLQRLQNRVIKNIRKLTVLFPSAELYSSRVLNTKCIYIYEIILLIYKVKNNMIKCNVELQIHSNIHDYSTRNKDNFYVSTNRTKLVRKDVFRIGPKLFNRIPNIIKNENSLNLFKMKLKDYIFNNLDVFKQFLV